MFANPAAFHAGRTLTTRPVRRRDRFDTPRLGAARAVLTFSSSRWAGLPHV